MRLALAAGLAIMVVSLGIVLSRAPVTVAGTNDVPADFGVAGSRGDEGTCQPSGTVPQGTTAIRVSLSANSGPRVSVKLTAGSTLITEGSREAGWGVDETVTVPVRRVQRTITNALFCAHLGPAVERIQVNGARAPKPAGRYPFLLRLEYLRSAGSSWLSLAPSIARDMGLAHAPRGTWVAYLTIAVMVVVAALASRLALRELR